MNFAYNNEEVEVEIISNYDLKYCGKIINFNIVGKKFVGQVHHKYKSEIYIFIDELSKSNLVAIKTPIQLTQNDFVYIEITGVHNNILHGKLITKLSSDLDDIINFMYDLDNKYADLLDLTDNDKSINDKRIYLTDHDIFTIDPPTCLDCDDAFSIMIDKDDINKYHIYVHIADITEYINPSNPNFEKIIKRGNTIYGSNRNWPMIPRILAENICSILPNKLTNAITSEFIYDTSSNKIDFVNYFYSKIISKNKYDYEYVDNNINSNLNFQILNSGSKIISKLFSEIVPNNQTEAHKMVSSWMMYLNNCIGKICDKLYRVHLPPTKNQTTVLEKLFKKHNIENSDNFDINNRPQLISQLEQLKTVSDKKTDQLVTFILKSIQTKAIYSEYNMLHYGIGIDSYTHFTSPIRRASDLLIHLTLKGYDIDIKKYLNSLNDGDNLQNRIETFIRKHKYQINVGKEFDCIIVGINKTGIVIYIYDLDDTFNIHISKLDRERLIHQNETLSNDNIVYNLFDNIKTRVIKYDFFRPEFEII